VVAGSNPVSPTTFVQVKTYFYLLPLLAAGGALDSVSTMARIAALVLGASAAVSCAFCLESDVRMAATSSRRVVTRESVDGGRASVHTPK
jgi:hypothetical protein